MHFNKTISFIREAAESTKIIHRTAVRAIIIEEEKILMVRSRLGYYKLPGGGVEKGESLTEALVREVAEETGYINCGIKEELGIVSEHRLDHKSPESHFHMVSRHFLCELDNKETAGQSLIGYELEEGYQPVWVPIQEVIDANNLVFKENKTRVFILRENFVLEWLRENL
ncbi:NUDIX domain-containing protein [Planococcus halotolerans]|nr:NUDIX domain-containing protein [Planococcus halotolerans]QHJ72108.1 NUDIX domain-containing protein [Planococcus halotolerans]